MIGYIKGMLAEVEEDAVLLENNGIGYRIRVPGRVLDALPAVGEQLKLYTYMHVREDAVSLSGFRTKDELDVFRLLLSVSGVGPKGALGILSVLSANDLRIAVHAQDSKAIAKAPGIGAKTAQRVIIDLKDRLNLEDILPQASVEEDLLQETEAALQRDAVEALTALGYGASEAAFAVRRVALTEEMTVEDCLKQSLKYLI